MGKKQKIGGKRARESDIDSDEESEDVQPKNKPRKQRQVENLESEVEEVQDDVEPPEEEIQEVDDRVDGSLDEHEVSTVQMTKKPKLIKSFIIL